jgi:hypothetical protein
VRASCNVTKPTRAALEQLTTVRVPLKLHASDFHLCVSHVGSNPNLLYDLILLQYSPLQIS